MLFDRVGAGSVASPSVGLFIMKNSIKRVGLWTRLLGMIVVGGLATKGVAQTPPSDLTELSLEQILSLHVVKRAPVGDGEPVVASKTLHGWSIGYRYIHANFSGHRDGTDSKSNAELLVPPPPPTPHDKAFLILPTNIRQEAHVLELAYRASDKLGFMVLVPYIFQSSEHVSTVPGFSDFTIDSQGLGDVSVTPTYEFWSKGVHSLTLNSGLSIPFGTINETGDTPGAGPVNSLPYTMQIGSGTVDFLPGLAYKGSHDRWRWSAQALATVRLGRNYRGYSLGNRYALSTRVSYQCCSWLEPVFGLRAQTWERVNGSDPNLPSFPGPLYPASVADPRKYGGDKINASLGARFNILSGWFEGGSVEAQASLPVYQRLNGPQPEEQWQLNLAWKWHF